MRILETLFVFLIVAIVIGAIVSVARKGFQFQEEADKNCSPYVRVSAFEDTQGKVKSVCLDADGGYVIKP